MYMKVLGNVSSSNRPSKKAGRTQPYIISDVAILDQQEDFFYFNQF